MRNHSYENDFDLHENETACRTNFLMKGFAIRLVLKQRHKRTRKNGLLISHYLVAYFTVVYEFKRGIAAGSCHCRPWGVSARKLTNDGWRRKTNTIFILFLISLSSSVFEVLTFIIQILHFKSYRLKASSSLMQNQLIWLVVTSTWLRSATCDWPIVLLVKAYWAGVLLF